MEDTPCIMCSSRETIRYGYYKTYRKYRCKSCGKQFSERSFSFFCRHRFPEEVIRNAILYGFFVSTRNIAFLVEETMNFSPSHVSAYNWIIKFASLLNKQRRAIGFSKVWHVDEKFVKIRGCKDFAYLWVVMDDKSSIIAVHVSQKRDVMGARTVLKIAKERARKPPDILVTDGLQAYIRACRKVFGRKAKHTRAHFETKRFMHKGHYYMLSNNRIESLNSKINLWYKKHRGFKRIDSANLWSNMWMNFYNFMRPRTVPHEIISIHQLIR